MMRSNVYFNSMIFNYFEQSSQNYPLVNRMPQAQYSHVVIQGIMKEGQND